MGEPSVRSFARQTSHPASRRICSNQSETARDHVAGLEAGVIERRHGTVIVSGSLPGPGPVVKIPGHSCGHSAG